MSKVGDEIYDEDRTTALCSRALSYDVTSRRQKVRGQVSDSDDQNDNSYTLLVARDKTAQAPSQSIAEFGWLHPVLHRLGWATFPPFALDPPPCSGPVA